jgi:hypothetical protein
MLNNWDFSATESGFGEAMRNHQSEYPGFLLENQRLRGRASFRISAEIKYTAWYILQEVLSLVEITNVILKNKQCCKRRNFRKIAIFNRKFNNEKVS